VEICQDLWNIHSPSETLVMQGANLIFNLSASTEVYQKNEIRRSLIQSLSARGTCAYIYCSTNWHEPAVDCIFGGTKFIACDGAILAESLPFSPNDQDLTADLSIPYLNSIRLHNSDLRNPLNKTNYKFHVVTFSLPINPLYQPQVPIQPFVLNARESGELHAIVFHTLVQRLRQIPNLADIYLDGQNEAGLTYLLLMFLQLRSLFSSSFKIHLVSLSDSNEKAWPENHLFAAFPTSDLRNNFPGLYISTLTLTDLAYNPDHVIPPTLTSFAPLAGVPNSTLTGLITHLQATQNLVFSAPILDQKILISDFILYHTLMCNEKIETIIRLIKPNFGLTEQQAWDDVTSLNTQFYNNQTLRSSLQGSSKVFKYNLSSQGDWQVLTEQKWRG
jgi:hypothetical protein